jgi:lipopolysaccharide/colanic/teichoic acid biosynthesis glycosyltransferase
MDVDGRNPGEVIARGGKVRRAQPRVVFHNSQVRFEGDSLASEGLYTAEYLLSAADPMTSWRYQYVKRGVDVFCALAMTAAFAIPGLLIAAVILLTSEGPVFYREERIGRDGRPFQIWKFRSMFQSAAQLGHFAGGQPVGAGLQWRMNKNRRDPRITWIGNIIRRWSLDELPQLFNVIRGEMSLIGPRPIVQAETRFYGNLLAFYLAARPGLSGLWQVSGRSNVGYADRAELDASYVRTWCLGADFSILFRTIPAVLSRIGAR